MDTQSFQQNQINGSEIRLNEIEEKQRLLKERTLLIGENLISTKEKQEKENIELKTQIKFLQEEIKELKNLNKRILYELKNLARKSEVEILQKQFKMFEPLEIARIKDIKEIIKKEMNK